MIPTLNDLRLVETGRLILHEAYDRDRLSRLRERIEAEGVQRNPVIVAPHGGDYLVLDGAHRVHALSALGCRLVLVQLVENPRTAESWGHLLAGRGLEAAIRSLGEIEVYDEPGGGWLAEMELPDGRRIFARSREAGLPAEVRALWGIRALYPEGVVVRRLDPDDPVYPADDEAVIRYRSFTPEELVEVVSSGAVLPAGVTRFRVRERVLGVRFPLWKMKSEGDDDARNAELKRSVKELWDQNRIRYYGEPVVLFE